MLTKQKKREIMNEIEENSKNSEAIYFSSISGVKTLDLNELRNKIKTLGNKAKVIKKTLLELALKKLGFNEEWRQKLKGSVLVNFAFSDPVSLAKVLVEFSKQNTNFKILGGILNAQFITLQEVNYLASIPAKDELYGRLAGSMALPIYRLNYGLKYNLHRLVTALSEIQKIKK